MLLAVFSDSHGNVDNLRRAVALCRPDRAIFLGDGLRDAETVAAENPSLPFILLRGNCDWSFHGYDESILFTLDGVRIFAAHGHRHGVKTDYDGFWNSVACSGSALGLFGHTHAPDIVRDGDRYLMNPGSVGAYDRPSFGLVRIDRGSFSCELRRLENEWNPEKES